MFVEVIALVDDALHDAAAHTTIIGGIDEWLELLGVAHADVVEVAQQHIELVAPCEVAAFGSPVQPVFVDIAGWLPGYKPCGHGLLLEEVLEDEIEWFTWLTMVVGAVGYEDEVERVVVDLTFLWGFLTVGKRSG